MVNEMPVRSPHVAEEPSSNWLFLLVNHDVKLVVVEIAIRNSGHLLRRRLEGAEMRTIRLCSLEKGYMGEVWTRFNHNF